MNITHRWKRFTSLGCSHGNYANPRALAWALKFKKDFDPHTTIHLGDFVDLAALRSGSAGSSDSAKSISEDFNEGVDFLRKLAPNHIFIGNHEDRLYCLQNSPNAIVAHCASKVIGEVNDLAKELRAKIYPYNMQNGFLTLGNFKFLHGFFFNESAIRDHAEAFGNCVIAHLHKVGSSTGRRDDSPEAFCVGTLADIPLMSYAKTRRATMAWSHGLAYGEYCEKYCHVQLKRFYEKEDKLD